MFYHSFKEWMVEANESVSPRKTKDIILGSCVGRGEGGTQ